MKRWHRKTQFIANEMAQGIQTISQNRDDKRITIVDLINVGKMAYLTIFPGGTVIPGKAYYYPLGYYATYAIFYVRGIDRGKASVIWGIIFAGDGDRDSNISKNGMWYNTWYSPPSSTFGEVNRMVTNSLKNVEPSQIHQKLSIKQGEVKIIVECCFVYCTSRHFGDGTLCSKKSFKEVFGLLFLSPKYQKDREYYAFFNSVAIFTPKAGLFDDTIPQ